MTVGVSFNFLAVTWEENGRNRLSKVMGDI